MHMVVRGSHSFHLVGGRIEKYDHRSEFGWRCDERYFSQFGGHESDRFAFIATPQKLHASLILCRNSKRTMTASFSSPCTSNGKNDQHEPRDSKEPDTVAQPQWTLAAKAVGVQRKRAVAVRERQGRGAGCPEKTESRKRERGECAQNKWPDTFSMASHARPTASSAAAIPAPSPGAHARRSARRPALPC